MMNDDMDMIDMVSDVSAMIFEVNLVEKLYMGNFATADIKGEENVILKMTSEKEFKFTNVLYVLEIRKNLVSGWLLNKFGFHLVFKSDKFVLSMNQMYVGHMWEAIQKATYLLNKGYLAKVAVPAPKAQKIGPKSVDCIFIRYAKNNSAYRFIVYEEKNLDIQKNTVMESRNASFFEHIFSCLSKETRSSSRLDEEGFQDKRQRDDNNLQDEIQDQTEEKEVESRRSKRARNEKSFGHDFVYFMLENEPMSYREAMKADGTIDKCKARLVIKGFRQHEGLDYFDTYSPVTNDKMIRSTKDMLKLKFDIMDMGLADVILGIKIIRTPNGLVLSQAHYVKKILNTHNVGNFSQARTPIDTSLHLSKNKGLSVAKLEYSMIIGMLMYLMTGTKELDQWGYLAKVVVPAPKAQKIGPKSVDCIFIGYAKNNSAYRLIVYEEKNLDIQKNTVMESRNASFFEHIFSCLSKETGSSSRLDEEGFQDKRQRDDNNLQDEIQDQTEEEEGKAIKSEKDSILQNYTWELVDLPPGCKPLGYKWIFKKKLKADGTIDKYKARLVIKGTRPDLAYVVSRLSRHPAVIEGYRDANWISDIKDSRSTSVYLFTLRRAAIS
nr:zinc finger, CCHC-type [Tanacetum cinerariifolium]